MQDAHPILNIQIIGLNEVGHEVANDLMTTGRTTPWLQDVDANANQVSDVWYELWDVTYRDVIIVNGQNEPVDVYNLTTNDLGVAANYAALRDKLVDAAMTEQRPWQNSRDRFDINDDGFVVPGDVLIMINEINATGSLRLPPPTGTSLAAPYWDSNGDNFFSPIDILQVINFIEQGNAEGEAAGELDAVFKSQTLLKNATTSLFAIGSPSPVETEPVAIDLVVSAIEITDDTVLPSITSQSESNEKNFDPAASAGDDFWADYWPSDVSPW